MTSDLRVLFSTATDPWFNLATEDWIFREFSLETQVLLLWRNRPSIVIGRHQNPWLECDVPEITGDGVALARRQSGGGAVYHDLGNTNYTFFSPAEHYDRDANFRIVLDALRRLGITAVRSGRNDILVHTSRGDRKISGNAFKHTRERCFHHGTLLVNADLPRLQRYLTPDSQRLTARGTRSVSSPVVNLQTVARDRSPGGAESTGGTETEITHHTVCDALVASFHEHHGAPAGGIERDVLDERSTAGIPALDAYYRKMKSWEWCYGATPYFERELVVSEYDLRLTLNIDRGRIAQVVVHCGMEKRLPLGEVVRLLTDARYDGEDIACRLRDRADREEHARRERRRFWETVASRMETEIN